MNSLLIKEGKVISTEDKDKEIRIKAAISDLFDENDPMLIQELPTYYVPLQRKEDMRYELEYQISKSTNKGHKLIHQATNRYNEEVLVFQTQNNSMEEEQIRLRIMIITPKGLQGPYSYVYLVIKPEHKRMHIQDFRIEGDRINRGYGSIAMGAIKKLVDDMNLTAITGSIKPVDWDHIERSQHFYNKHGFICSLNTELKVGSIEWRESW